MPFKDLERKKAWDREYNQKVRYPKRISEGRCTTCGRKLTEIDPPRSCMFCNDKERKRLKIWN
jgi:rubrerythrin